MQQLLNNNPLILMEAAIVEQLRRSSDIHLHKTLVNAPLIYEESSGKVMAQLYQNYIDIANENKLPFLMLTPTWRTNKSRVFDSEMSKNINIDAVRFMKDIRDSNSNKKAIKIGGLIGCKNDCYRPEEGLNAAEAETFHAWQIDQLKQGGVDFLIAQTLPFLEEAIGIAKAMEASGLPYIISFVIDRKGVVLDGTSLYDAVCKIDAATNRNPLGYMVNCAYPSFLCPSQQPKALFSRFIAYQANASSLDQCELDNADELQVDEVADWGEIMLTLHRSYGIKMLGGCCGTGSEHLRYIVDH